MNQLNKKRLLVFIGIISFILIMFILSRFDQREDFSLIEGKMHELIGPWTITVNDVEEDNIILPYENDIIPGVKYSSSTIIPFLTENQDTLLIRSSMQDLWVYIDDVLIHEHVKPEPINLHMPLASLWVLVDIPEDSVGKTLRIDYLSNVSAFSGVVNEVYLDRKSMILNDLYVTQIFSLGVFLILLIFGVISIIVSFAFIDEQDLRLLYLGFMSITSGLWVLTEARLLQYFTGNRFVLGSLAYLMIPIMAFFFSLYIKDAVITQTKYKRHLRYIALSFIGLVIINIILQLLGVLVYIEMMQYTLPIILISAIYASYLIYLEITKHQNNEAKRFIKFTVILLVSLIFEIGSFFFGLFSSISSFFRIGIVIFFVVIAADTFMFIRINMRKRDETLLLEKMAYKDFLTGGYNRSAYERDVQKYIDSNKKFRLILLDLNELKLINDTYGHAQGDEAIRIVFKSMEEAFEFGNKYRIGGDEFAVLMDYEESNRYLNCIENFHNTLKEKMIEFVYPLNVAIGTDVYINDQWEQFGKFYHHVDQLMYMNKNRIKNKESI